MQGGTWNLSDMYPTLFGNRVTPPNTQQFSGPVADGGAAPKHILLGIVLVLVAIRVLWEQMP